MRAPDPPGEDDFDEVARAILAGLAGAVTGAFTMLAAVHLPILLLGLQGDEPGGLVSGLGFVGVPIGVLAGAFAGVHLRRRFGCLAVGLAMVVAMIGAPMVIEAAEREAVRTPPLPPHGAPRAR